MRQRYIRVPAEKKDTVAAAILSGAAAAAVGVVTFYLTRTFLAREPLPPAAGRPLLPRSDGKDDEGGRE
jgi:hypothetical protein